MQQLMELAKQGLDIATIVLAVSGLVLGIPKLHRYVKYRDIRKILSIKDGDTVIVVASELDDAEKRQLVEEREFIYLMKYGDVDAWVETIFSLLRIYPNLDLRIMSSGEARTSRLDLGHHMILIGGPDYNKMTERIIEYDNVRMFYLSPDMTKRSRKHKDQIVIADRIAKKEYCHNTIEADFGYFERIENPFDTTKIVILIGGCHTVGVTGAAKIFSAFSEGRRGLLGQVASNAKKMRSVIGNNRNFCVVCPVKKIGSTISTPRIEDCEVYIGQETVPTRIA